MGRIEEALSKLRQIERSGKAPHQSATVRPRPSFGSASDRVYGAAPIDIDDENLRAAGLLVPEDQQQRLVDQYRTIKRPLLRNAIATTKGGVEKGNLIMIASAFSEEGKSFTALNTGLSIAREQDWSVVLIDGDTSKRHLSHLLGVADALGLTDLLRDPTLSFESLVMPTSVPRLAFLPAGKRDEHAAELLASDRMTTLCENIAQSDAHRAIVFDSSPLLMSPESPVLSSQVGQVVLVVRANHTRRSSVSQARDRLDPKKPINLLLNQIDWGADLGSDDYYSYGK